MEILETIVERKKREVAQSPARLIAAGDLRDGLLARGERRDFLAALRQPKLRSLAVPAASSRGVPPPEPSLGETPRHSVQWR